MSERPKYQLNSLYILNFLLLHDVATMSTFSDDKNAFYNKLLADIKFINSYRQHNGIQAEIYTHYILCGIEILVFDDQESAETRPELENIFDKLTEDIESIEFYKTNFISDLDYLFKKNQFFSLPKELLYKLVAQCLYFDYDCSTFWVFAALLDFNIFKSGKSQYDFLNYEREDYEESENAFIRSILFFEFETLKDKFNLTKYNSLNAEFNIKQNILKNCLFLNEDNLKKYFKKYNFFNSNNLILNDVSDCIGYIGCWFALEEWAKNRQLTIHREEDGIHGGLAHTASMLACAKLDKVGLKIMPRAVYNRFLRFESFYNLIRILFKERSKIGCRLDLPDFDDSILFPRNVSNIFYNELIFCRERLNKGK